MGLPRLDILISCHDGRGLGHASRSIAIGMALRRLFPQLRILFVSGCTYSRELIASSPLEWCKLSLLPDDGKKWGIHRCGRSLQLYGCRTRSAPGGEPAEPGGTLPAAAAPGRSFPPGKHRELLPALALAREQGCQAVLGVRGVIGSVPQIRSSLAANVFRDHYSGLLWYGDSSILGDEHLHRLEHQFGCRAKETGYVSRFAELGHLGLGTTPKPSLAGTISLPWLGENGLEVLKNLIEALGELSPDWGEWHIYHDGNSLPGGPTANDNHLPAHCHIFSVGAGYSESLFRSKTAVIYGGYNSIVDVLAARVPALVIERPMADDEQQIHLGLLRDRTGGLLTPIDEAATRKERLAPLLHKLLTRQSPTNHSVSLSGAERAARFCQHLLGTKG